MLNKVFLMGRLTRDPELRHTQTNTPVTTFSIAVDRDYKDRNSGERGTDFIEIVAWRQTAEFISRYFTKGRMIVAEGRLQMSEWTDKEGNKRRSAQVVADNVYFGDSKREGDKGVQTSGYSSGYNPAPAGGGYGNPAPAGYGAPVGNSQFAELTDDDGELPF